MLAPLKRWSAALKADLPPLYTDRADDRRPEPPLDMVRSPGLRRLNLLSAPALPLPSIFRDKRIAYLNSSNNDVMGC